MNGKLVLVKDLDDGVIVAKLDAKIEIPNDGTVEVYRYDEYYHSLDDALRDMYGIQKEEKE